MKSILLILLFAVATGNSFAQELDSINSIEHNIDTPKAERSVVDEYNEKRKEFLKKREKAKEVFIARRLAQIEMTREALAMQALKDEFKRRNGIPISRFDPRGSSVMSGEEITSRMGRGGLGMMAHPPSLTRIPPSMNGGNSGRY